MALSKPSSKYVEEMLDCSICLDRVKDPHTLQGCFHTFCKSCIDEMLKKQDNRPPAVECPVCRNFNPATEIRSNFFIKDLAEMYNSSEQNEPNWCEQCAEKTIESSWKCLDCKIYLCQTCQISHLKIPVCKGHRVVPLTEETEKIVDKLVYCKSHPDKPVELYCQVCKMLICLMCKATAHDSHKSMSVDDALKIMVPSAEENIQQIEEHLSSCLNSITEIDRKIDQTRKSFTECCNEIDAAVEGRIRDIKQAQKQMKQEVKKREDVEISKLERMQNSLNDQRNEGETFSRIVRTSLEKARHASLLSELVIGGLFEKMELFNMVHRTRTTLQTSKPVLHLKDQQWKSVLLGEIVFTYENMLVLKGCFGARKNISRFWVDSLVEYFSSKSKKGTVIGLRSRCTRIAFIDNQIWAPLQDERKIQVYDLNGQLAREIDIEQPVSVEVCFNEDVFIACKSNKGLYLLSNYKDIQKICDGSFSDVCKFFNSMYVLQFKEGSCQEFAHDNISGWVKMKSISLRGYGNTDRNDTLLVTSDESGDVKIFVASRNRNVIYQFNINGDMVQQYKPTSIKLYCPHICGIDGNNCILVADSGNSRLMILDPKSKNWTSSGLRGDHYVYDTIRGEEGSLWLMGFSGSRFNLSLFCT